MTHGKFFNLALACSAHLFVHFPCAGMVDFPKGRLSWVGINSLVHPDGKYRGALVVCVGKVAGDYKSLGSNQL
jgi:hypothetical protein